MKMDAQQAEEIGREIVRAREVLGWTQTELATRTGFTDNTIRKVERGEHVGVGTLRKVRDTVGLKPRAEQGQRVEFPREVQALLDIVGMYLMGIPEGERSAVAFEVTQMLLRRSNTSGERPITDQ